MRRPTSAAYCRNLQQEVVILSLMMFGDGSSRCPLANHGFYFCIRDWTRPRDYQERVFGSSTVEIWKLLYSNPPCPLPEKYALCDAKVDELKQEADFEGRLACPLYQKALRGERAKTPSPKKGRTKFSAPVSVEEFAYMAESLLPQPVLQPTAPSPSSYVEAAKKSCPSPPTSPARSPPPPPSPPISEKPEMKSCVVCFEEMEKFKAIVPCGHANVCSDCLSSNLKMCPTCRVPITATLNLYF